MELKQFTYFEAVYKCKSISKAADSLYLTQQCLSKQIQLLEKELNTTLFRRTSHGVEVTEDGEYFHTQAAGILSAVTDIEYHFSEERKRKLNTLVIGISHGFDFFFNESFFHRFSDAHPEINIEVYSLWNTQAEDQVKDNTITLGLTLAPLNDDTLNHRTVMKAPLCCIVNSKGPFADRTAISINDMLDRTIAMADENYNSYHWFVALCEEKQKWPRTEKMFDLLSIYQYVIDNPEAVGFTLFAYRDFLNFRNIRYLPIEDFDPIWQIELIWKDHRGKKQGAIAAFSSFLDEYIKREGWRNR